MEAYLDSITAPRVGSHYFFHLSFTMPVNLNELYFGGGGFSKMN